MRHKKSKTTLGRESQARNALLRSLMVSLILHERITTTLSKAKAVRPHIEKLVTKATQNLGQSTYRFFRSKISDTAVKKLIKDLAPKYSKRKGGYTRIIKLGKRKGDAAEQAIIEFV